MAKQIVNEMATNLTLDSKSAAAAIKQLTQEVKSASAESKIMENQYKAAGDTLNASKAKYEGLQTTIEKQKAKVDDLKQALENNNTTTKKGQELQTYLTNELAKAERQYASYNGQLAKAEQAYKYQESGLAKLNEEVKHGNDLTDARVKKLEAEGNKEEAQKVKLDNLKNSNEKYNQMLTIQKNELNKLSESGDKNSDAYKRQQLRVEQMGAKVAETTRDIKHFNETDIKPETRGLNHVKEQLSNFNQSLDGTRSHFKTIFMGNLVANGVTNALGSIKSHITGVIQAGIDYDKEMQNIQIGLDNFTGGNKELAGKLLENIKGVKEESGYATDTVALLTKKTYGLTKNTDGAKKLSDAFVNLGRATGMGDDKLTGLITKFSQANASGEITTGSITKLNKQLPGFSDALAKSMNVSKDKLSELASSGKLSMQDLAKAIETMSDAKPKGLDNYYKTVDGFTNHFEERYKSLSGKITESFFSQSNNMLLGLSKSLDGKAVDKAFNRIGDSANKAVNTVVKAFSSSFKGSKTNPVADMANFTADSIGKIGNWVAKHAGDIKDFFKMIKELGSTGFSAMGTTLKIAIPLLERLGSFVSKHPTTFKVLAGSIIGLNLALKGLLGTMTYFGKAKKGLIGLKNAGKGVGKAFKWTGKLLLNGAKKALSAFATFAKGTGKIIGKGLKFTASVATKGAKLAMAGLVKAAKATGKGLKLAFNFLKANPFILIITGIVAVVAAFVELYKHNKKFREFVNNLVKSAKELFKNVVKWFEKLWDKITDIFDGIKKTVTKVFNSVADFISDTLKVIHKSWTGVWNSISGFFSGIWKSISKLSSNAINAISGTISDVLGGIGSTWRSVWGGLSSFFSGIWRDIKGFAQDGINGVLSVINAGVDGIDSVWKFFTGHETSIHHLKPVRFEQGGIVQQRLAMVNDGSGEHWKELIQLPNGEMKMSQQRNAVMALPVGTRVYNGKETKAIMSMAGIEKYANGGIVGSAIDWTKGALSDVGSWIGDKMDAITSFLKSPLSAVKSLISKATSGIVSGMGNFGQLATGAWDKLANSVAEWFTKALKKIQDEDGGGGKGAPSGSGVSRWRSQVVDALKANGLSTSSDMVNKVLRQIQTESGGNEKARQPGADPDGDGSGPAIGLMQTKMRTFLANAFPGHGDILNGYDDILAGLRYAKARYGSSLSFLGNGHGYANGGLITKNQMIEVGEGNKPEMIIPLDGMKSSRGFELLGKTAVAMAARDGASSSTYNDNELSSQLAQSNTLLATVTQLLASILGETQKGNEPLSANAVNAVTRTLLNRAGRLAN
ncbi:tape measure protein [Leuconostoc falkenbergense]|uniref:tape measure protein n=1 Tax=Leuconostoc falkenbergense TaxID=2766470 RepID=UPI002A82D071|nr:tape measure protein [Leuconostoc falkenbergense]MDY5164529.1 tape measure protein [Leuconostoc falkenbergense]